MPLPESFVEKLRWYFVGAFVLDALGMLDQAKKLKLTHLSEQHGQGGKWQRVVEEEFGIDHKFVIGVHKLCVKHMTKEESLCFLMRGLGCLSAEARMRELLGDGIDR